MHAFEKDTESKSSVESLGDRENHFMPLYKSNSSSPFLRRPVKLPKRVRDATQNQPVQRKIDLSGITQYPILSSAVLGFHQIEEEDITRKEFEMLKKGRDRFMPLMGRFALAKNTTLKVGVSSYKRITGDFAVTQLLGKTETDWVMYDKDIEAFVNNLQSGKFVEFEVRILFWLPRVRGGEIPGTLKTVGTIQQAFTHEMSIHAENMLDLIEAYWEGNVSQLPTPSEEHTAFKEKAVARYEYMSARSKQRREPLGTDFSKRELDDRRTAK